MRNATASFATAALLFGAAAAPTTAQVDELTAWLERERPAHVLAQVCISEASMPEPDRRDYDGDGDLTEWVNGRRTHVWGTDCWAIHEVFLRGADRLGARTWRNYMRFAMQYSGRVFNPPASSSRPWIAHLPDSASHAIPEGWPVEWRRVGGMMEVRTTWAPRHWEAYQYARAVTEDIATHTLADIESWSICDEPVDDWGGDMDAANAARIGLVPVACGEEMGGMSNQAYARPSEIRRRTAACELDSAAECWWITDVD